MAKVSHDKSACIEDAPLSLMVLPGLESEAGCGSTNGYGQSGLATLVEEQALSVAPAPRRSAKRAAPQGTRGKPRRRSKGKRGDPGPQGERGEAGPPGERGEQGAPGPVGPRGEVGLKGERGEAGPQGARGEKGDLGDPGKPGPQGEAGPRGLQGERGAQGAQGERGVQGPQGERGLQGPEGERGPPGPGDSEEILVRLASLEQQLAALKQRSHLSSGILAFEATAATLPMTSKPASTSAGALPLRNARTITLRSPSARWMSWAAPLLLLSGLAWYFLGDDSLWQRPQPQPVQKRAQTEATQPPAMQAAPATAERATPTGERPASIHYRVINSAQPKKKER